MNLPITCHFVSFRAFRGHFFGIRVQESTRCLASLAAHEFFERGFHCLGPDAVTFHVPQRADRRASQRMLLSPGRSGALETSW